MEPGVRGPHPVTSARRHPLRRIIKEAILDGKSLVEWSEYEGVALWWFVDHDFERTLRGDVATIGTLVSNNPVIYRTYEVYEAVAALLSRYVVGRQRVDLSPAPRTILATELLREWKQIRDPLTGEPRMGDGYLDSVTQELVAHRKCRVIATSPFNEGPHPRYRVSEGLRVAKEKIRLRPQVPYIPLEAFWHVDTWRKGATARRRFSAIWRNLRSSPRFVELLQGCGDQKEIIEQKLSYYFTRVFGRIAKFLDMSHRLLAAVRPNVVLMVNERSAFEMSLVVAARRAGVPTVAVQHGVIHPEHWNYVYEPGEVSPQGGDHSPFVPIPDQTAVYGEYDRRLLTTLGSFPANAVVVTGQPRYDVLALARHIYVRKDWAKRMGVPAESRLILWITHATDTPINEHTLITRALLRSVARVPNTFLLVKPHPDVDEVRLRVIRSAATEVGFRGLLLDRRVETLELLGVCDLMITKASTAVIEAAALGKPVIVFNPAKKLDAPDFVSSGIAAAVHREEDLAPTIVSLLDDASTMLRKGETYLKDHLAGRDGNATERVVNLVVDHLEKRAG